MHQIRARRDVVLCVTRMLISSNPIISATQLAISQSLLAQLYACDPHGVHATLDDNGTFRVPLLFSGLRRVVNLVRRAAAAGRR